MKKKLKNEPGITITNKGHKIKIIKPFCKSCEICIKFCPEDVLGLGDDLKVAVFNPDKCTGCRICEYLCPDLAIFVDRSREKSKVATTEKTEKVVK